MKILNIEVSPNAENSSSRKVAHYLLEKIKKDKQNVEVTTRDLNSKPVPHVTGDLVNAYFAEDGALTVEQINLLKLSNELVDEVLNADILIISAPMWNFGMPSVLKAWFDHVVRAGRTFSFDSEGLKGLVAGKKVYVVLSSGSIFSEGAFAAYDQFVPSIKTVLGFVGMTDVEIVRVEGTNDSKTADKAIEIVKSKIDQMAV